MPRILIQNADIITLDGEDRVLRKTDLAIDGKTIAAIGRVPAGFAADETIDARDHVALPGFFNAHSHAAMTLERGYAEDLDIVRWFNERIWRMESALTEEDVYWGTALAACEMIRSGTVGFSDLYFWMSQAARVVAESGMKALLGWGVFGSDFAAEMGSTTLELTENFVSEFQNSSNGRIKTILAPHSPYICSERFLVRAAASARKLGVGCHIHVSETRDQLEKSLQEHGKTPVRYLDDLGIFDNPSIAAHAIHITDEDIDILAKKRASVVQCVKTHMKLAMGTTRVPDLQKAGVNVALGADGPASNNDMDMLEVTRLAALIQKHDRQDATLLPSTQVLKLATQNGARAMGFTNSGVLKEGADADLILINMDRPHLVPRHDLAANIVHSARGSDVAYVIVDGKILMRRGELTTLDEEKIKREAEARALRMARSDLKQTQTYQA